MSTLPQRTYSPQEYLEIDRAADTRNEYFRGEIFAMSGGSSRHSLIAANILGELRSALRDKPCTVFTGDLRIGVSASGLYTYPDVSVACGELQFDDKRRDTLLNPVVLVEVLSETTEAYDRGKKFQHYQKLTSLREYLVVGQDAPIVELFSRNDDGTWKLTTINELGGSLIIPAIGVTLPLSEVYAKVEFPQERLKPTSPV